MPNLKLELIISDGEIVRINSIQVNLLSLSLGFRMYELNYIGTSDHVVFRNP